MGWNLFYGLFNGILGIAYRSVWLITMCAFFLTLGGMCFSVVMLHRDNKGKRSERLVLCHNGITMFLLAIILACLVAISFLQPVSKTYPVAMMIAIAAYTFFLAVNAIRNVILAQKEKSLSMITLRNISLAGATASMLTLQRSMTATFGGEAAFANTMNGATGMGAFLIVLALGVSMIIQGSRKHE